MVPEKDFHDLRVERFLDPQTGAPALHILWKDVLVSSVLLGGKAAEQISGLTLIQKDLTNARRWMGRASGLVAEAAARAPESASYVHATDRDVFDEAKAFFVAALTFYAKAYTEAAGRKAQMQRDWLDEPFRARHDYFMDFRHNFAAHSGDMRLEFAESFLLLIPESGNRTVLRLFTSRVQPDVVMDREQEGDFARLIEHAIAKVTRRYDDAGRRLMEAAVSRPLAFWAAAGQGSEPVDMDAAIAVRRKRRR